MRRKVEENDTRYVFLGYYEGTKRNKLMYLDTKNIIKSYDVEF